MAGADIPALLRKGDLESLEGESDSLQARQRPGRLGVEAPLEANVAGRHMLSGASSYFANSRLASRRATLSVSRLSWGDEVLRPKMPNGGVCFPDLADGLYRLFAPKHCDVCKAVLLRVQKIPALRTHEAFRKTLM